MPEDDGAGHVGVVAVDGRAEVELEEVAVAQLGGVGPVVRDRRVGAGGDDRLEGRRLRAERQHPGVELPADLQLGAARAQRALGGELGQRLVGDGAGAAQRLDLVVVLDRAQAPRPPAGPMTSSGTVPPAAASASTFSSAREPVDGDVVGLVAEPAGAAAHRLAGAAPATVPRSTSSSTSGTWVPAWVV